MTAVRTAHEPSVEALVQTWASFWSEPQADPRPLYRDDALHWALGLPPEDRTVGTGAIVARRDALHRAAAGYRLEPFRTIGQGDQIVVEALAYGRGADDPGLMGTGVCAFLDLRDGRIAREEVHGQWEGRRPADEGLMPHLVAQDGKDRGALFYRELADRMLAHWSSPDPDPDAMIDECYDPDDYVLDDMITKRTTRLTGREHLRRGEHAMLRRLPVRETHVDRLVWEGNTFALAHVVYARSAPDAPLREFSSLMVLTVGERGLLTSEHTYMSAPWPRRAR